jgi:hypothetical protein
MIPVIPISCLINLFRYIIIIPKPVTTLIDLIIFYMLIVWIIRKKSFEFNHKEYLKIMISFLVSFIVLGVLENLTYPVIMFLTNETFEYYKDNIIWNFILVMPSRIIEYLILAYFIIKQNNSIKINVLEVIVKNKLYLRIMIILTIFFNFIIVYSVKLIGYDKILEGKVSLFEKILISEFIMIIPSLLIFMIVIMINDLMVKQKRIQQAYENLIAHDDCTPDVEDL